MKKKIIISLVLIFLYFLSLLFANNTLEYQEIIDDNKDKLISYYQNDDNGYLGVLKIPKLNIERGFYDYTNKENDLGKNIFYLKESIPFNKNNSMIILAAHRGRSKVAFFNTLEHLEFGDELYLDINHQTKKYILQEKYDELKDGKLDIYRDKFQNSLILITCNRIYKDYQTIYVAYAV